MTSPTDITERRRRAKRAAKGADRKRKIRKSGTTPQLYALITPKHVPENN